MVINGKRDTGGKSSGDGSLLYRFSLWIVPYFFRLIAFLLFAFCRVQRRGREHFTKLVDTGSPFIISFWHYGVIYIVYQRVPIALVAMVSASKDGEYIARILRDRGFTPVRGSRNRGAIGALKGLMREMALGKTAVLVADGSQGPARIAQAGTILLASKTGASILPVGWAASRYKTFRSWDRTALPLPFSKVVFWHGAPINVPADLKAEDLEKYRLKLEQSLNDLYDKSWGEFGKKEH